MAYALPLVRLCVCPFVVAHIYMHLLKYVKSTKLLGKLIYIKKSLILPKKVK